MPSLKPSKAVAGGGLIGDVDVTLTNFHFGTFTYPGKNVEAFALLATAIEEDETETPVNWTMGQLTPTKDGKFFEGGELRQSSNLYLFLNSLIQAGFPEDKIEDDITVLDGIRVHIIQQLTKRTGGVGQRMPRADGRVFEPSVVVVTEILELPWEKKSSKASKKDNKANSIEDLAIATILDTLVDHPKGLDTKKLASLVFSPLKENPDRNSVIQKVYQDEFLGTGPWVFNGKTVKMEKAE